MGRPRQITGRDISRAVAMRENGATYREIAEAVGCSVSTIGFYLGPLRLRRDTDSHGVDPAVSVLRQHLYRQRMSVDFVAAKSGVCRAAISRWIKGESSPCLGNLRAAMEAAGLTIQVVELDQ